MGYSGAAGSAAGGSAAGGAGGVWGMVFSTAMNLVQQKLQADAQNSAWKDAEEAAENQALLQEEQAKGEAAESLLQSRREISRYRKEAAQRRAATRAEWGGAGLANSGSVALGQAADAVQDRLDADDMRFNAQQQAQGILSRGRAKANATRIGGGADIKKSTLSLGSGIYGPRR
ncbi:hypothetical protein [Salidesulfovibrio onnuriiensis]|uniref:hypothetical protein n=1 Tax=Salidesulfovibrio onnuriiensis TaxID=2583823 RepID=UPI0011CA5C91|nr:hypothetical protein [Salidesulfovibrio onnuriiensis]